MEIDDLINNLQPSRKPIKTGSQEDTYLKDDLRLLKQAWTSERMAPELLPFVGSLLDRIMERIRRQVQFIEENSVDLRPGTDIKMQLLIVESELERIKFLVRGYLRCRLTKIDKYSMYFLRNESAAKRLSPQEKRYMQRHQTMLQGLYKDQFLESFPESLQTLDDTAGGISMIEEPDLDKAVCIRVLENVERPIPVGGVDMELKKGCIYMVRYSAILRDLSERSVELV